MITPARLMAAAWLLIALAMVLAIVDAGRDLAALQRRGRLVVYVRAPANEKPARDDLAGFPSAMDVDAT